MARREPSDRPGLRAPLRGLGALLLVLLAAGLVAFAGLELTGALDREEVEPAAVFEAAVTEDAAGDPFRWQEDRAGAFKARAQLGYSHVLYELSPGGVVASAKRTARFRSEIESAASEHGVDADLMEAMVFLESAGRPQVIAGGEDPEAASGLAQILASTGTDLLGMRVDLARSTELTREISSSEQDAANLDKRAGRLEARKPKKASELQRRARGERRQAERALEERARVDERFDPKAALDGMGTYLEIAEERFGGTDFAVTSYHMGIGNLGDVIGLYVGEELGEGAERDAVSEADLTYAQLFFDSSPTRNAGAWDVLEELSDDSSTYYWRVLAAREIMRLWREDPEELDRLVALHGNKSTSEEVFHPESETETYADPEALADGLADGDLTAIPDGRRYGFRVGKQLGELADRLGVERALYESLRPEALATLIYMSGKVTAITGKRDQRLIVTSAVRDRAYQDALVGRNPEATAAYSLHTTGYSFDVLREYANGKQAGAFQFVLDRLSALGVIDYAVEPRAIHVTVSPLAEPLLDR